MAGLFFLALGLSACTTTVWQKPGVTGDVLQRDTAECDRQADRQARAAWDPGHATPGVRGSGAGVQQLRQMEHRRRFAQCMRAKGYVEVQKDG